MMTYILVLMALFLMEVFYFRIADHFNIIDKPNERSSHTSITLRGGGIIFYLGVFIYFVLSGFQYPWFFIGLTLMTLVSFMDDIYTLSNRIRLCIHFVSVVLMAVQLELFSMPWYFLLVMFIIVVGVINAYNFMDGINGITVCYSLAVSILLLFVNKGLYFVENDLLIFTVLSLLVFAFFNFRTKAKCFAGDVGSVAIAFILLFALGLLIFKTQNFIYILFLVVYGIDAVWTIIRRLYLRENIFDAHRSHLYQFLGNEAGVNKLAIAFSYGFIQLLIGILVIYLTSFNASIQWMCASAIIVILSIVYLLLKRYIMNKYLTQNDRF